MKSVLSSPLSVILRIIGILILCSPSILISQTPPRWLTEGNGGDLLGTHTAIEYGNGIFVRLSSTQQYSSIYISKDTVDWLDVKSINDSLPIFDPYRRDSIAFGNGTFVLTNNSLHSSKNGIHWNPISLQHVENMLELKYPIRIDKVTFCFDRFVALDRSNGLLLYSKDNGIWNVVRHFGQHIEDAAYHSELKRWFAVNQHGVAMATEKQNWLQIFAGQFNLELVGNALILTERDNNNNFVTSQVSFDGRNWKRTNERFFWDGYPGEVQTFFYNQKFVRFRNVFVDGTRTVDGTEVTNDYTLIEESEDLLNWTEKHQINPPTSFVGASGKQQFIGFGYPGMMVKHSGETWMNKPLSYPSDHIEFRQIAFSHGRQNDSVFLGIDQDTVYQSKDGFEWKSVFEAKTKTETIEYIEQLDSFALSSFTANDRWLVSMSKDGENWSELLSDIPFRPQHLIHGNDKLLLAGFESAELLMSSDNGESWSDQFSGILWHEPMGTEGNWNNTILQTAYSDGVFVLTWDDKLYRSTDAQNWELTADMQPAGSWYTYLDTFNDQFIATTTSHQYVGRYSILRWEGSEYNENVLLSADGIDWNLIEPENPEGWLYWFCFRSKSYDDSIYRGTYSSLANGDGPYLLAETNAISYIMNSSEELEIVERSPILSLERNVVFGKGRYVGISRGLATTVERKPTRLISEFVGFGSFPTDESGWKNTGWMGLLDDTFFPNLNHELFGRVKFEIDDSDTVTLSSPRFGILTAKRGDIPTFYNELDGNTYKVNFDPESEFRYLDIETGHYTNIMKSEESTFIDWFIFLDTIVAEIQQNSEKTIISSQNLDTYETSINWIELRSLDEKFQRWVELISQRFPNMNQSNRDHLLQRQSVVDDAIHNAVNWFPSGE